MRTVKSRKNWTLLLTGGPYWNKCQMWQLRCLGGTPVQAILNNKNLTRSAGAISEGQNMAKNCPQIWLQSPPETPNGSRTPELDRKWLVNCPSGRSLYLSLALWVQLQVGGGDAIYATVFSSAEGPVGHFWTYFLQSVNFVYIHMWGTSGKSFSHFQAVP